jgi:uncharacterized protein
MDVSCSIDYKSYFRIRTITCFIHIEKNDFSYCDSESDDNSNTASTPNQLERKIRIAAKFLHSAESTLTQVGGYTVQTIRIATNPFGEWLQCNNNDRTNQQQQQQQQHQLRQLDIMLEQYGIEFCSLGPANTIEEIENCICPIITTSHRFSCSANLRPNDTITANSIATIILQISQLGINNTTTTTHLSHLQNGLGNFRFCCTSANTKNCIPFFPAAKAPSDKKMYQNGGTLFAIGLENGPLVSKILRDECNNILSEEFSNLFSTAMIQAYSPLQSLCRELEKNSSSNGATNENDVDTSPCITYMGIDTSLNPSLDDDGSIAAAIEAIDTVTYSCFGRPGTLAVAATITQCLQSLSSIQMCGYCGLMLPVCEDQRLSELVSGGRIDVTSLSPSSTFGNSKIVPTLRIADLLSISQVCGVGVDTVPISGNCSPKELVSLLLDVTGIAHRWNKSLSCRVFPVPGKDVGEWTTFDSPFLVNTKIMPIS